MSDLKLNADYYSFAPTGQREVDLILHAVARAGKAFHHTSQWTEDEMAEFYEHCEGDTCVEWIQNAANKAAAELAALRAELEVFREREAATAQGVRWLENESKRIERRAEKAEAELTALRERVARLVGSIEPVAKVHINRTGGNVGIAWRAIGIDGSLPALADGEILYVLRTALGER